MGAGVMKNGGGGGRRRRRSRRATQPMAEINVTPFVDVMLVLLIIFMVAAPLLTVGVPIELPKTNAQALPSDTEEPLTVSIGIDGKVWIQSTEVTREELVTRLRAIAAERSDDRVYLRADGGVDYGVVAEVMTDLNNAGFSSIGLVTDLTGTARSGG